MIYRRNTKKRISDGINENMVAAPIKFHCIRYSARFKADNPTGSVVTLPLVITRGKHGARVRDWLKAGFNVEDLKAAWLLYMDLPDTDTMLSWIQNGRNLDAFGAVLMGLLERLSSRHKDSGGLDRGVSGPWVCEHRFNYVPDHPDCKACAYRAQMKEQGLTLQGKLVIP